MLSNTIVNTHKYKYLKHFYVMHWYVQYTPAQTWHLCFALPGWFCLPEPMCPETQLRGKGEYNHLSRKADYVTVEKAESEMCVQD